MPLTNRKGTQAPGAGERRTQRQAFRGIIVQLELWQGNLRMLTGPSPIRLLSAHRDSFKTVEQMHRKINLEPELTPHKT